MTDEFSERQAELTLKLFRMTNKKLIDWSKDESTHDIVANFGDQTVSLSYIDQDNDGNSWEIITITDRYNIEIDRFSDGTISDRAIPNGIGLPNYYAVMRELRITAERQARNVDRALNSIFAALDALENPKPPLSLKINIADDLNDDEPF